MEALYFVDWHNTLIGHMQHSARDPICAIPEYGPPSIESLIHPGHLLIHRRLQERVSTFSSRT